MEEAIIKSVVSKCRSGDLETLIRKWGWFSDEDLLQIDFRAPKRTTASTIFGLCQELHLKEEIGDLDLLCTQINSSSRKWTVLKMKGSQMRKDLEPQELKERLATVLEGECLGQVHLNVRSFGGATWLRLYVEGASQFRATDVVYVLFYPHTPFLITCRMKVKIQVILYSALQEVFETEEISELQLTGQHLPSLADLALQQSAQGSFRKYRDLAEAENPLVRSKFKRKEPVEEDDRPRDPRLRDENKYEKQRRQDRLDSTFGTHTPPQLEKVDYKMDVRFRGTTFAPGMKSRPDMFRCRVKFEGPSILEGFKNLGKTGLAALPFPRHLARVQSLAKNQFSIAEMDSAKKSSESQSSQN
ncbi:centromere protein N-A-like [Babylonia areolata]|uniref:centromere protein N-A-like n=1 Tax=Babylonia areolata TaxID=304850 RepID=UPI003FD06135